MAWHGMTRGTCIETSHHHTDSSTAVVRFAEPLAYTSVFPYLPEMIRDFGVEQNKIARWAGLTSAVFSVAQSITAVPWGRGADRYGRKPMIILGLLSTMITFIIWGMSTSLPMAIVARAIQGGGNGNVGIIRTMVAEMVPEKELQPRAFSVMPLVWSLGSVVGPSFGGFFAHPARQWPSSVFGKLAYFHKFPYALPNLVAGIFFLISVAVASLFLRETLPGRKEERDWGISVGKRLTRAFKRHRHHHASSSQPRRRSFMDGEATAPLIPTIGVPKKNNTKNNAPPPSTREVFTWQTNINLLSYTFLAFHSVAYDQNLPVFLNYPKIRDVGEPVKLPFYFKGGFGLESGEIGTIFTCYGVACGLIQFLVYPMLVSRFGVLRCFRVCCKSSQPPFRIGKVEKRRGKKEKKAA
jgi:MFS family permease